MTDDHPQSRRAVRLERTGLGQYVATNVRGGTLVTGAGEDQAFTPVELLLAAIGGCSMVDVDHLTSRRAEPRSFVVEVSGDKVHVCGAGQLEGLTVRWEVEFPAGAEGDAARRVLPDAVRQSHERLCTVGRTVERGTPIAHEVG